MEDVQIEATHWPRRPATDADAPYDIDGNGDVDIADVMRLTRDLGQPAAGN